MTARNRFQGMARSQATGSRGWTRQHVDARSGAGAMDAQHTIPAQPARQYRPRHGRPKLRRERGQRVAPRCQCRDRPLRTPSTLAPSRPPAPRHGGWHHDCHHCCLRRRPRQAGCLGGRESYCSGKQAEASLGTAQLPRRVRVDVVSTSLTARRVRPRCWATVAYMDWLGSITSFRA